MEDNQEITNQQENSSLNNTSVDGCKEFTPFERYKLLIAARNFHYDNFNKWLSYFYIAIGVLFVGFYTLKASSNFSSFELEIKMILFLGYIISLLWYLSCKGYYFWNINFITLVNNCEEECLKLEPKNRVYFVFANKKTQNDYINPISGANISTSKVAILFSFIITISWGILLLKEFLKNDFCCIFVIPIIGTILLSWILGKTILKSKINHFPNLKIKQKKEGDNSN